MWNCLQSKVVQPSDPSFRACRRGYGSTQYIDHSIDVASCIEGLFGKDAFSDVVFVVQGVRFSAHKVILAARSEYFRALLYGGLAESSCSLIHLNDINATAFRHVLQYMYSGRINIKKVQVMLDVLGLAHQYDLRGLESALSRHLTHSLRLSNVWLIYNLAVMYNLEELVTACLKFLDCIAPAPIQSPQFLSLSQAAVERLLSRDSFRAAEIEIFRSLQAWFRATQEINTGQASIADESQLPRAEAEKNQSSSQFLLVPKKADPTVIDSLDQYSDSAHNASCNSVSRPSASMDHNSVGTSDQIQMRQREMMRCCVRFELMSLTELLTEVRASKLVSPDDLLDAISRQTNSPDTLPHRGWMLPGVNLASPRFACSLVAGEQGGYPYFFVDELDNDNDTNGLGNTQISLSALDLTSALVNGAVHSTTGQEAQTEDDEIEDEDEDERLEDQTFGELFSIHNNDTQAIETQRHHIDSAEESEGRGPGVVENGGVLVLSGQENSSAHQLYRPGNPIGLELGNRSMSGRRRSLPGFAPLVNRGRASFRSQRPPITGWCSIPCSDSQLAERNSQGQISDRNNCLILNPNQSYNLRENHDPNALHGAHMITGSFVYNNNSSVRALGESELVNGSIGARSLRWMFPLSHRRVTCPPNPPPLPHSEHEVVRHSLTDPNAHIVIRLGKPSFVNTIRMRLWDRESRCYSYYVEVSLDEVTWYRVVDYRNYPCRSWQMLHFPSRVIQFIRVTGTRNTANRTFHLITFRCMYKESVCQQVNGFLIPTYNVATVDHGATVLEGVSRNRNALIDGNARMYDWNSGYTCHQLGNGAIVVQLAQPFLLRSMRLLLWDLDDRTYSYAVYVSTNREDWRLVHDATRERCQSWQIITFPLQLVTFIRVVGSYNTANEVFHLVHLECPYPPAEQQPDNRASSPKVDESVALPSDQTPQNHNSEFVAVPTGRSSRASSDSNSVIEHASCQATQATELPDNSSVLTLDPITDSSLGGTELEVGENSLTLTTIVEGSGITELLPSVGGSLINLPRAESLQVSTNLLGPEPDTSVHDSVNLHRAQSQHLENGHSDVVQSTGVTIDNFANIEFEQGPNGSLSRHLTASSSMPQTITTNTVSTAVSTGTSSSANNSNTTACGGVFDPHSCSSTFESASPAIP